jgi:4'-phosphopantetheinyl transferase
VAFTRHGGLILRWCIQADALATNGLSGPKAIVRYAMVAGETTWHRPGGNYVLPQDEVHVWRATPVCPAERIDELATILAPDERQRADRFHFDLDRRRYVVGRGLLRTLLGHCLGTPADELRFDYSAFGKPSLAAGPRLPLQFNVSHSGELVLIALTLGRALGVDVERIRPDIAADRIATQFFSANECEALATLAGDIQCDAFFSCWTRKEAYLKARGDGLSLALDQFDVAFLPGEAARLLETRHDPAEACRWALRQLDPGRGYKAALAVEGSDWKLKCWDWPAGGGWAAAIDGIGGPRQFLSAV